jgi:cytochrome c peroxidase
MGTRLLFWFCTLVLVGVASAQQLIWSAKDWQTLRQMHISQLGQMPKDPSNRVADNPQAAAFGHRLFFDARLSSNGAVSCATCHDPLKGFTDQLPLAEGVGTATRNTPSVVGTGRNEWFFWDGRADSLWSQALGPLESLAEHNLNRMLLAKQIEQHHKEEYERVFGRTDWEQLADQYPNNPMDTSESQMFWKRLPGSEKQVVSNIFVNVGKALAAYQRQLDFGESRFDRYVGELEQKGSSAILSQQEIEGLKLFIGQANCVACHSGAILSDQKFHNTGVKQNADLSLEDTGRSSGLRELLSSEFTCLGSFSDNRTSCGRLEELGNSLDDENTNLNKMLDAFKTPSLRNVAQTFPYMHAGQQQRLWDVLQHYNTAPKASLGSTELNALQLSSDQLRQLEAFLRTLSATPNAPQHFLQAPK